MGMTKVSVKGNPDLILNAQQVKLTNELATAYEKNEIVIVDGKVATVVEKIVAGGTGYADLTLFRVIHANQLATGIVFVVGDMVYGYAVSGHLVLTNVLDYSKENFKIGVVFSIGADYIDVLVNDGNTDVPEQTVFVFSAINTTARTIEADEIVYIAGQLAKANADVLTTAVGEFTLIKNCNVDFGAQKDASTFSLGKTVYIVPQTDASSAKLTVSSNDGQENPTKYPIIGVAVGNDAIAKIFAMPQIQ